MNCSEADCHGLTMIAGFKFWGKVRCHKGVVEKSSSRGEPGAASGRLEGATRRVGGRILNFACFGKLEWGCSACRRLLPADNTRLSSCLGD